MNSFIILNFQKKVKLRNHLNVIIAESVLVKVGT